MTRENIEQRILSKKNDIDKSTLEYFTNYFFVLSNKPKILGNNNIDSLIDNALLYASKIVFYGENSKIYKRLGPDCKGLSDSKSKTIYIRENLPEPLREITVYHELHHAVQTNPHNNEVGINQTSNIGRMIMEAQTQYFAEMIYEEIHGVVFEEREIPSENLRMKKGGTIISSLHNYEMYDSILSKLSIMLDVPKDFFVAINYLYKNNNEGLQQLKEVYEDARTQYEFPYDFEEFLYKIDYIICVDVTAYIRSMEKSTILSGKQSISKYEIYPERWENLSQQLQYDRLDDIDRNYFLCLVDKDGDYKNFAKYILDSETKRLAHEMIDLIPDQGSLTK